MEMSSRTEDAGLRATTDASGQINGETADFSEASQNGQNSVKCQDNDEASRIKALSADIRNQDELERSIGRQADQMLADQANERDGKRLEKTQVEKAKLQRQVHKVEERLKQPMGSASSIRARAEISNYEAQIDSLDRDIDQIKQRIEDREQNLEQNGLSSVEQSGNRRLPNENHRDFLIRTGKITPFSKLPGQSLQRSNSTLEEALLDAEVGEPEEASSAEQTTPQEEFRSHRNLIQPGFSEDEGRGLKSGHSESTETPRKRRRLNKGHIPHVQISSDEIASSHQQQRDDSEAPLEDSGNSGDATFVPDMHDGEVSNLRNTRDQSEQSEDTDSILDTPASKTCRGARRDRRTADNPDKEDLTGLDDGNERLYQARLKSWTSRRSTARYEAKQRTFSNHDIEKGHELGSSSDVRALSSEQDVSAEDAEEEWHMPHPTRADAELDGGYRVPGDIYPSLFDYQKTGVQWLWELYSQQVGGIIGDEMGLGKTIQVIAFLAGLHYSKKIKKPIIVVTPGTVMKQWVNEFHTWWPPFRVSILHTSGSGMIDLGKESRREEQLSLQMFDASRRNPLSKSEKAAKTIVDRVIEEGHVLVTTYSGLQTYAELLIPVDWEYVVLDEGHKIRNPNTAITIYCKELRTANRIILSGTPMQNNLVELWSLFDFVFPMRLGTLVNFRQQFEIPIRQGGYANASNLQVQTASRCAETLKDTISPYLLQRFKMDVAADLPKKTEQVLFCKLTKPQREAYEKFLSSDDMKSILNGKRQVLYGIDILRKICNHPDLQDHRLLSVKAGYNYGSGVKSGKMVIVKELLDLWKKGGHKTLLFAQHRIMLDILERYVRSMEGIDYLRMDGNTPIQNRQSLVDDFNNNPDVHVFLLTTKVGGLGVNLTGADRVIIYDPDWNPSTDIQARERAWRLGQKREVQIFRLMIAGSIEEKIFHRQLFKQFLTNKILKDPKQRQTFQMKDLHDLFTLSGADEEATETGRLFAGAEVNFNHNPSDPPLSPLDDRVQWGGGTPPPHHQAIRDMAGITSVKPFEPGEGHEENAAAITSTTNSEARIMEGIFARSGIHSALEHDQIVNGKKIIAADPKMIEREAKKVATQAAAELRKAGELARTIPVGTPTWTGQFGTAGRPSQMMQRGFGRGVGRIGPASASILANLQNRQAPNEHTQSASQATLSNRGAGQAGIMGKGFMRLIRDYMITHGGKVHTQMLINHFNRDCGTAARTAEFKAMLKEIATLQKGSRGRGAWILKEEYKYRS